jgi:hypothetical protein
MGAETEREAIEAAIREAFAGVALGSGVSLRQAAAIDRGTGAGPVAPDEIVDDWSRVPESELRHAEVAHLDGLGLRYYLPALMLWTLDHYDDAGMRGADVEADVTIHTTVLAVAPIPTLRSSPSFPERFWAASIARFDPFTDQQRAAVARFVAALPDRVSLQEQDASRVARALDDHWSQFLPAELP